MTIKKIGMMMLSVLLILTLSGCTTGQSNNADSAAIQENVAGDASVEKSTTENTKDDSSSDILSTVKGSVLDTSELFSSRDLEQTANLADATYIQPNRFIW